MFVLPELPYDHDALEPTVSTETLQFHHDKHHKTYVEKTNELSAKAGLGGRPLEEVIREARKSGDTKLFNNAAQAWNHAFYWQSMTPEAGKPTGELATAIDAAYGGLAALKTAFVEEGFGHFGSGWVWLVAASGGLKVISTHDADDTLVREGAFPLLVCDLWEHAYYLDYQNDRKAYLGKWFDDVANWAFAAGQFAASEGKGEGFRYPAPEADAQPDLDRRPRPVA